MRSMFYGLNNLEILYLPLHLKNIDFTYKISSTCKLYFL